MFKLFVTSPTDPDKTQELTKPQLEVVQDYLVTCMNSRVAIQDKVVVDMLERAGLPILFDWQEDVRKVGTSLDVSINVRPNRTVKLLVPMDLKATEADRLCQLIQSLVLPPLR